MTTVELLTNYLAELSRIIAYKRQLFHDVPNYEAEEEIEAQQIIDAIKTLERSK